MEGKKIPEYLNISQTAQVNNQPLSIYTFFHNEESSNPENSLADPINSSDKNHACFNQETSNFADQIQGSVQTPIRSKDENKSYQQSSNNNHSNSLTFLPKGNHIKANPFQNTQSEQESEKNYRNLTYKLQNALHKISSSGKALNKSSSQSNDIWKRSELQVQRKKKQIQKKRQLSEAQRLKQLRDKPEINKYSEKIVKEIGHEPIHVRFQKIVERKKKKIEETEETKKRQKEQEQNFYMQELNRHMKKSSTTRTYNQYFNEMVRWKQKAEEKKKQKLQEQKKKEIENATFKPILNNKSKRIVAEQNRLPIDQRGLLKVKTNPDFTFTPKINKRSCK